MRQLTITDINFHPRMSFRMKAGSMGQVEHEAGEGAFLAIFVTVNMQGIEDNFADYVQDFRSPIVHFTSQKTEEDCITIQKYYLGMYTTMTT
jgi:hypothetical protein